MDEAIYDYLSVKDEQTSDFSDGAWQCYLEDFVKEYNAINGTEFDPYESLIAFCSGRFDEQKKEPLDSLGLGSIVVAGGDMNGAE